jgi:hypothetical protein
MQINNNKTGEVLRISKVDAENNKIYLLKYGSDISNIQKESLSIDLAGLDTDLYGQIVTVLGADYEASTEPLNWLVPEMAKRIIIDTKYINEAQVLNDPQSIGFSAIITKEKGKNLTRESEGKVPSIVVTDDKIICYINDVASEDTQYITPLLTSGVAIIEEKPV